MPPKKYDNEDFRFKVKESVALGDCLIPGVYRLSFRSSDHSNSGSISICFGLRNYGSFKAISVKSKANEAFIYVPYFFAKIFISFDGCNSASIEISDVRLRLINPVELYGILKRRLQRRFGISYRSFLKDLKMPCFDGRFSDISIVIPCYKPDLKLLRKTVKSITKAFGPGCEVVLVDDATPDHPSGYLDCYKSLGNIQIVYLDKNSHISLATNAGISVSRNDWIGFCDQDDLLHPEAGKVINYFLHQKPESKLVYTDEDKIMGKGRKLYQPHFKPSFSPDTLYSTNYISHFSMIKKELLNQVGGLRKGYEGAQDYDLILRAARLLDSSEILHVPYPLYNWRAIKGSTAYSANEKSYTVNAGLRALQDRFESDPRVSSVELGELPNTYRVQWKIPSGNPLVDIIIPTRNHVSLLRTCINSIFEKTSYENYKITVVDNQSNDEATKNYLSEISKNARVNVISYDFPFNYSAINNFAVSQTQGEYILLLNNDTAIITEDWLYELIALASRREVGCVGCKLLFDDSTIQHGGVALGVGGVANHSYLGMKNNQPGYFGRLTFRHNVSAVTGACLMTRRDTWKLLGGLDADNLAVAFNDIDYCLKALEEGLVNVFTPYVEVYHFESRSRGKEDSPEKIERFQGEVDYMMNRWGDYIDNDPYYSMHLSRSSMDYSIRR